MTLTGYWHYRDKKSYDLHLLFLVVLRNGELFLESNHKTSAGATLHCWRTVLQFYYLDNKRFTSDSCYKKPKIGHQTCQN